MAVTRRHSLHQIHQLLHKHHAHHSILGQDSLPKSSPELDQPRLASLTTSAATGLKMSPKQLLRRADGSSSSTSGSSSPGPALPIAIAVVVPVTLAIIIFIVLHRRHIRRLRREDTNDPHRSLDFGMDGAAQGFGKKKGRKERQMVSIPEPGLAQTLRRARGMSMDIDVGSAYLLPPEVHNSRESLRSLSRSPVHGGHDPYHVAASNTSLLRSPLSEGTQSEDNSSTGSSGRAYRPDGMQHGLLRHAQRMSRSTPPDPAADLSQPGTPRYPPPAAVARRPVPMLDPASHDRSAAGLAPPRSPGLHVPDSSVLRQSSNYLATVIRSRETSVDERSLLADRSATSSPPQQSMSPPPRMSSMSPPHPSLSPPPRLQSISPPATATPTLPQIDISGDGMPHVNPAMQEIVVPPALDAASRSPREGLSRKPVPAPINVQAPEPPIAQPEAVAEQPEPAPVGLGVSDFDFGTRRLSVMRPLPPDDPNDNAEQRANRIRSFYKEYFNDNETRYLANAGEYYEDYGSEYLGDGAIFDPETGQFVVAQAPYAAPVTRRAMTPPPRGPPRMRGPGPHGQYGPAMFSPPRSRAMSVASTSRMGPARGRGAKRHLPPPQALRTLPTPSKLREDAFALPIDFAPPQGFRDQAAGRPSSPLMQMRPFSPNVPIASPLASSFSELPSMPSPHQLRKSSTFTALDFAPPPRFFTGDNASDTGSIRSGRSMGSAMSAAQAYSLRAGAYRVSRIPKELAGTRDELNTALRPTWKVGS